jgi:quinol-cytochrome oxidoreductase complex cytochrome b subunit
MTDKQGKQPVHGGIGWLNVVKSTIAAACGVQTNANRERDFQQGKPVTFIIAGLVFVLVFILGMVGLVQLVLSLAAQNG